MRLVPTVRTVWLRAVVALAATSFAYPVLAQDAPTPPDVVVVGQTDKPSDWKRADTDHATVFSRGSTAELTRVARELDLLHRLMSRLYRDGDTSDEPLKLTIVLVDSAGQLRDVGLTDLRAQEGPFSPSFTGQRYYNPGEDGAVLVVARSDQFVDLNTNRRFNLDCDWLQADGNVGMCGMIVPDHMPVIRPWEAVLYSAYAQHFMLTYTPAAYPRWYLDGIGALFSTLKVNRDGTLDYALPPIGHGNIFKSYGYPNVPEVLTGRYLATPWNTTRWSPYGAWLLTHYFVFSKLKPERGRQFERYMAALRRGAPMAAAAAVFGDLRTLDREVTAYAAKAVDHARALPPTTAIAEPLVTRLSLTNGALVEARLALEARRNAENAGAPHSEWLARLASNGDALLIAAEAECRGNRPAECLAFAERALAREPGNAAALAWKGVALTDQALAGPATARADALAAARETIARAVALDGQAPLPRIALFRSYTRAGEAVPQEAMRGMTMVVRSVPAAPGPRLELGRELVRQGNAELARRLLYPVLNGGYDSPEKRAALALFTAAGTPGDD